MPGDLHNDLALMALTWLGNKVTGKGLRGTTEVTLAERYVADAVALCSLQSRFFRQYCRYSGLQPKTQYRGRNSVYETHGDVANYFACIFEAKISRGDFLGTFGNGEKHRNRRDPIGSLHWCVTPKGLITTDELPEFWGHLEVYGTGLTERRAPKINLLSDAQTDNIAHKLLWPLVAWRNRFANGKRSMKKRIAELEDTIREAIELMDEEPAKNILERVVKGT